MIDKRTIHKLAVLLVSLYFFVDALQKLVHGPDEVWILKHKSHQLQNSLHRHGLLLFEFSGLVEMFAPVVIMSIAAVEIVSGALFIIYEAEQRLFYAYLMLACLAFDAFVMRFPFTETERNFSQSNNHFSADLAIAATVLMAAGFEELEN